VFALFSDVYQSSNYTLSQKTNQLWQAVVSSSMDWFWQFLGKQHQHTFTNYMHI